MDMSGKVVNATLWGDDVSARVEWQECVPKGGDTKSFLGGLASGVWGVGRVSWVDPSSWRFGLSGEYLKAFVIYFCEICCDFGFT